ncbi:neocarzinostatin apoprotein domain-containing protein [Actinomadura sp. BRA 177]|uniref:neocarzinostatin apoprotein domain-containing protein n=1 Tax=Actinomadura sp. BRA 177 TaxID=2745202 RepID=UPI001595CC5C|nr:neocarzinostatin apoprotein domain-containing protein [Actinomadura sp. BRA 177]NVI92780.1 hypothetical protein [Actinomadura sp. BRA 177]
MPSSRPRPTWARPLSAVPLLAAAVLAASSPAAAAADAKPEITVTPSENLAAGTEISVQGTGFEPETLLFVAVCDSAKPLGSACDTGNYAKATTGADGTLSTKLKVVPTFGDTDCAKTSCALMTNDPADPKSTRNYVTASLTFTGGGGAAAPAAEPAAAKEDEGGSGGILPAGGAVAVVVVAGVVFYLVRRARSAPADR